MNPIRNLAFVVLLLMVSAIIWASLRQALWAIPPEVSQNPWFLATLADAYCGFVLFYAWLVCRERQWGPRIGWLIAILSLGNVATAGYLIVTFAGSRRRGSGSATDANGSTTESP
jgi:drug/metabolite transporter (DMT)-like permease